MILNAIFSVKEIIVFGVIHIFFINLYDSILMKLSLAFLDMSIKLQKKKVLFLKLVSTADTKLK